MKNIIYALRGLLFALRTEWNMRFHLAAAVLVICAGIWLHISSVEWLVLCICIGLIISFELMNSAIEQLCNMITQQIHPAIKNIKDISAAAVLVASVVSAVAGLFIFLPKLLLLF